MPVKRSRPSAKRSVPKRSVPKRSAAKRPSAKRPSGKRPPAKRPSAKRPSAKRPVATGPRRPSVARPVVRPVVRPVRPVGVPAAFWPIADDCAQGDQWARGTGLGAGVHGAIYRACRAGRCDYALKVQPDAYAFRQEAHALSALQGIRGIPKLYAAWSCDHKGYLVMDELPTCGGPPTPEWRARMYARLQETLREARKRGWLHVDIHSGNVLCRGEQPMLIDWGLAVQRGPMGDDETYPEHWVSAKYGRPATWAFLEAVQAQNAASLWGTSAEYDAAYDAYVKAKAAWLAGK